MNSYQLCIDFTSQHERCECDFWRVHTIHKWARIMSWNKAKMKIKKALYNGVSFHLFQSTGSPPLISHNWIFRCNYRHEHPERGWFGLVVFYAWGVCFYWRVKRKRQRDREWDKWHWLMITVAGHPTNKNLKFIKPKISQLNGIYTHTYSHTHFADTPTVA